MASLWKDTHTRTCTQAHFAVYLWQYCYERWQCVNQFLVDYETYFTHRSTVFLQCCICPNPVHTVHKFTCLLVEWQSRCHSSLFMVDSEADTSALEDNGSLLKHLSAPKYPAACCIFLFQHCLARLFQLFIQATVWYILKPQTNVFYGCTFPSNGNIWNVLCIIFCTFPQNSAWPILHLWKLSPLESKIKRCGFFSAHHEFVMTEPPTGQSGLNVRGFQYIIQPCGAYIYTVYIAHWNAHKHACSRHSGPHTAIMHTKPHSWCVHLINPQDFGNKTVNPLLRVRVWLGRGGCISCRMRDGTWGGFIIQTGLMEPSTLCQPDSKLFYASGALIFHTVSSYDSPFPQRKIAGMKKKDSLWSIGPLRYWIQVTSWGRWGERESREGEAEDSAQRGVCMLVSLR